MNHRPTACLLAALAALAFFVAAATHAAPGYGTPLSLTTGTVYEVDTLSELKNAVTAANSANVPATILIADGTYTLDINMLHLTCSNLVVRSAGGNRESVVIRGPDEGPGASALHIFLVSAHNVTIADVTFGYCRYHGIQARGESPYDVAGLWVHNCHIVNCNEQFIKGSSSDADPVGITDGIVENCLFEFSAGEAYQYYTGGIDIHKGVNWTVRDNLFRNIRNPAAQSGYAEHAVHFWKRCNTRAQNVVVERNWVLNCDRGIGFGLGSFDGGHNGGTSVIRNNFIYSDGTQGHPDVGIGLEYADHVHVDNNTVYSETYWAPMECRFAGSSNLVFRNNLTNRDIAKRDGAPEPALSNNVERVYADWFQELAAGNLHLTANATNAIDHGCTIGAFADDLDGETRPRLGGWDVGADEYGPDDVPPHGPHGLTVRP